MSLEWNDCEWLGEWFNTFKSLLIDIRDRLPEARDLGESKAVPQSQNGTEENEESPRWVSEDDGRTFP